MPGAWSYIGLLAAFVSESATRFVMPRLSADVGSPWRYFWMLVVVATLAVVAVGWWLVRTRLPATIAATRGPRRPPAAPSPE